MLNCVILNYIINRIDYAITCIQCRINKIVFTTEQFININISQFIASS